MGRGLWAVAVLVALNAGVEAALLGADHGLWGSGLWRPIAYQYGGFWVGLLHDWQPNFAAQPVTMFLSYAVLHAGPGHMLGNVASVAVLGGAVAARVGGGALVVIHVLSALAGAVVFGALCMDAAPMVGASGAAFGLAGALVVWDWALRRRMARTVGFAAALVVVNAALWWIAEGNLAWQTHLGGFVMGAGLAGFVWPAERQGRKMRQSKA